LYTMTCIFIDSRRVEPGACTSTFLRRPLPWPLQGRWAREDYALLQPALPFPATPLFVTMHMVKAAAGKRELEVRPLCHMSCIVAFYYIVACRLSASAISGTRTIASQCLVAHRTTAAGAAC
jgi:hypothetical protein